jgi:MGT family glycosyltransferase
MPTAVFFGLPAHGHTNPSLPLVQELVARGHRVVYYSSTAFEEAIVRTGATFRPYASPWMDTLVARLQHVQELAWLLTRTTADVLEHDLPSARAERPDYVLADSVAIWGQWVAAHLEVPCTHSVSTFAFNRKVMAYAARHGVRPTSVRLAWTKIRHVVKALRLTGRLRRQSGGRGPAFGASMLGQAPLNIVYTSKYFQPCVESFDDRYMFVGPALAARRETTVFPWETVGDGPMVYVSLGTLFNADVAFYRACFEAFRAEPLRVVMSIGSQVTPEAIGPAPSNVLVRQSVPQVAVLERAAAFVTHGGMNSVTEGILSRVPLVVVPQMSEQVVVGRRVEELGAGLFLPPAAITPDALRAAVRRVMQEPAFRAAASRIRESFAEAGGPARGADAVINRHSSLQLITRATFRRSSLRARRWRPGRSRDATCPRPMVR